MTFTLLALFSSAFLALLAATFHLLGKLRKLQRQIADLQTEEDRVFDFLHSLGEAFSEGVRSADLHRLIVESASRILDAPNGALYITDKSLEILIPAYLSKSCPPLVTPPDYLQNSQTESLPAIPAISYLRLTGVTKGQGPIGRVWETCQPCIFSRQDLLQSNLVDSPDLPNSLIAAPLIYRKKILGVLALATSPQGSPFTEADLKVFCALTEQSAFALYTEVIYLDASEKKRLEHDLEIAREIQHILLPSSSPEFPGFDIYGYNIPARHVSGDYFDFIRVGPNQLGVAIADVSGKGVPASLIMAICRSVLRTEARSNPSPSDVLRRVNSELYPDIKEDMFISLAYLLLDSTNSQVKFARAGHDAPLLFRAQSRTIEKLSPRGMALGIDSGEVFNKVISDFYFALSPGDCLLLYTDGATEAQNAKGEEFGLDPFIQAFAQTAHLNPREIINHLTSLLKSFMKEYPQHDDVTLISIKKL